MRLQNYRQLKVWQKAIEFVENVYLLAKKLPTDERFGLRSQMCRSAVSIPANIAEGYARSHRGDYLRHLSISRGSLAETETHLTVAVRLKYLPRADAVQVWNLAQEIGKMLRKLIESLEEPPRALSN